MTTHHRHHWTQPDDTGTWHCADCQEVSATCVVTDTRRGEHHTGTSLLICEHCLDYEARVLDDIASALGHWQHQPRSTIPAIRYDRDRSDTTGADHDDAPPERFAHPTDVVEVLWQWASAWAGESASGHVIDVLQGRLIWASHNRDASAWEDYREEARTMRHHARRLAHLLPQRQAGPCPHCGAKPGSLIRRWADRKWNPSPDGLADEIQCTGCHMTWTDRGHLDWVNRTTLGLLPSTHPDELVTMDDARQHIFARHGIPAATWRSWLFRDAERAEDHRQMIERGEIGPSQQRMPERGHDQRGRALYRLGDIAAVVARRADEDRRGRRAG